MTTQLIWLRPTDPAKGLISGNMFHRYTKIDALSVRDLFENIDKYLEKIPKEERWNLFYSVPSNKPYKEAKKIRAFSYQDVLALDIDGIDIPRQLEYIPIVARFLGISEEEMTVTASGNGLHFILQLAYKIDLETLSKLQLHYNEVARKLTLAVNSAGLPGHFDQIFDQSRILRLPLTENRKDKKGPDGQLLRTTRQARLLQTNFTPHQLSLIELSGLQEVPEEEQLDYSSFSREFGKPDTATVLEGCDFLRWTRDQPTEVKEPLGYAALSILGRLDETGEIARQFIKSWTGSGSIQSWEPDQKIQQALGASGPRTCKNINSAWGKCTTCAFNGKVKSPITIQGPDFIRSEATGFYTVFIDAKGVVHRTPDYNGLLKAFSRETHYFLQAQGKVVWGWTGKHYREWTEAEIKAYAETKFDPRPTEKMRTEFLAKVRANNLKNARECEAFFASTSGLLNLDNGVLDIASGGLSKHSPERGFRYVLPYGFDPTAKAPRFDRFLDEVTLSRKIYREVLLDALAATLMPGYEGLDAGFWWFQGTGRNGKSKLIEVMRLLVGSENSVTMDPISLSGEGARFRLADMDGKLLTIVEEVNERNLGSRMLGIIKNISAGGMVPVERKGRDPYQMRATAKLVFTANSPPILEDVTAAVKRRFIPVPFELDLSDPACGVERDAHLTAKLSGELPGILNLVLGAARLLVARREFLNPPESRRLMDQIARDSDSVEAWLHDRVDTAAPNTVTLRFGDAYDDYVRYVQGENAVTRKTFSLRMRAKLGPRGETTKARFGAEVAVCFTGLRLTDRDGMTPPADF